MVVLRFPSGRCVTRAHAGAGAENTPIARTAERDCAEQKLIGLRTANVKPEVGALGCEPVFVRSSGLPEVSSPENSCALAIALPLVAGNLTTMLSVPSNAVTLCAEQIQRDGFVPLLRVTSKV